MLETVVSNPLISLGRGWLWFHAFGLRKFGLLSGLLNERCASKSCALETLRSPLLCVFLLTPKVTKEDWSSAHGPARSDPPVNLVRRTFGRSIKREIFSREGGAHMWPLLDDRISDGELHISNESCILIFFPPFQIPQWRFQTSPAGRHITMRAGETRLVPCWTTLCLSWWRWPRRPHFCCDARAGATRTCCCRPSTPPAGSWPTWGSTCASPRGPWRRAKPRPRRPPFRLCPSATSASRGCCPLLWWRAGTAASVSSVMSSSTPPTTTGGLFSPRPSTGPSRPSLSNTSGSPGVSRSWDCAWGAGCPATAGSARAGRGARIAVIRSPSAAWISA